MTPRNQVMAVALVLGLVGLMDFFARVHVPRSDADRGFQLAKLRAPVEEQSLAEARQRLQSWLPDARKGSPADDAADGGGSGAEDATEDVELPDRGRLRGRLYVLRGIFETDGVRSFAVLEAMPEGGGPPERHDVVAGDEVGGVRIESIDETRIRLSAEGKVIQLTLFLDPGMESILADESE